MRRGNDNKRIRRTMSLNTLLTENTAYHTISRPEAMSSRCWSILTRMNGTTNGRFRDYKNTNPLGSVKKIYVTVYDLTIPGGFAIYDNSIG